MVALQTILPARALQFRFVSPVAFPPVRPPFGFSTQGTELLDFGPIDGPAIAAGNGAGGDHIRALLTLFFPWSALPGTTSNLLQIKVYKTGDTVDPAFVPSPPHALLGQTSVVIAPGADSAAVAIAIETAINTWLGMLGLIARYFAEGGGLTIINGDQVLVTAPRTFRASLINLANGALAPLNASEVVTNPVLTPFVYAGFHPGPWILQGSQFPGFGVAEPE